MSKKRKREVIKLSDLEKRYLKDNDEDINYCLKYAELLDDDEPIFEIVFKDESDHDSEKNSYWVDLVLKRLSDGKFFSWGYQNSPWIYADTLSPKELTEVFPVEQITIVYE